ncbi:hypothetical protein Acy02nite_83990 [Actinoplanes cyaneus]|uniref:Galactosyltransferase C-terminal domain-containing protein n=1 Tax=Actinoplanes cyaneus TaxID=52696 RepID=A0A919ISA6_9ACTN|nr:galactosyltransferase-related protein [Actinoplanes cyaneus]MCW2138186.1 N-terminal domain of galactosyltransferase [Actinoplanes cyaneus]GID70518.1 hypothetical protein Acy02nite_83990 [Actinoplanes cyaneus]
MSLLVPTDPAVLARAVADNLVVAADPGARRSGLYYCELAQPFTDAVVDTARRSPVEHVRELSEAVLTQPDRPAPYFALRQALTEIDGPGRDAVRPLLDAGWTAECRSRVGYHIGRNYDPGTAAVDMAELRELSARVAAAPARRGAGDPDVLVVIPFQDRHTGGKRLYNLTACLLALSDQSVPRDRYRVVVVESDAEPRWRESIEPLVDEYLFAPNPGVFAKSWTVNVGVVHASAGAQAICILDADILVERDFIERNMARFRRPGTAGHIPYRDMVCLDYAAAAAAIADRLRDGLAEPDRDRLRAFHLRRPPGACVWVRTSAFHNIGGMDERYQGWGGEDNDFAYRMDFASAFDTYDDPNLHMPHPPASELREDGELVNAHIPPLSWRPREPIGRLDLFASALA